MALQMTMEDLEKTFNGIFEKKYAELKAQDEKAAEAFKAEESKKKDFRAAAYEVLEAEGQKAEMYGRTASTPYELFQRYVMCGVKSANMDDNVKSANKPMAYKVAQEMFPEDKALHGLFKKDLEVGVPSAGGFAIPQVLSPDVIRALYANTILDKVGATKVPMPNGNFRMARMDTSSTVGWVGEILGGSTTEPVLGDINLNAKKLFALVPVSNSLLRYNAVDLSSWIAQDLQMKASIALDLAAFYGTGTLHSPLGLLSTASKTPGTYPGLIPATQVIATAGLAITTPLDITTKLEQANTPMLKPAWVMSPTVKGWLAGKAFSAGPFAWGPEMRANKELNGMPFVTSTSSYYSSASTATGDLWLGDWSEFVWGVGYDISLEISREATFTSGGVTYSAFQRDETFVRLIAEHDFGVKHPTSFVCASVTA